MKAAKMVGLRKHLDEQKRRRNDARGPLWIRRRHGGNVWRRIGSVGEREPMSDVGKGIAFGLGVWTASYLGLLPALGILKPATQHPLRRNLLMIGAHVVWGASLAGLYHTACTAIPEGDERVD